MPYSFVEHTADIRMKVKGPTLKKIFKDALLGMVKILNPLKLPDKQPVMRKIHIVAPDPTALMVDFLNEALTLMHSRREAYVRVNFQSLTQKELQATLMGFKVGGFGEDIKAVTYHEAQVKRGSRGTWQTYIIFDI